MPIPRAAIFYKKPMFMQRSIYMEKSDIIIHRITEKDIDEALEIAIEAWTPIYENTRRQLGDELYNGIFQSWQESKRKSIGDGLRSGKGFIARDGDKVVGFIYYLYDPEKKLGTIGENAVRNAYRGKGIAGLLYQHVFESLKAEGAEYVKVFTGGDDAHAPARRAYEKAGFEAFLTHRTYYKKL
jgi:ribosomal protein S18 acetylase RimI-like enzyme